MISKNYFFLLSSLFFIVIASIIFGLLKGEGFYGYGNDFREAYFVHNYNLGSIFNKLGWIIATFSINKIHLGVHSTTFILSLSFGLFLRSIFKLQNLNNLIYFVFIFLIGIHTWPIIMSTSNAMRQGLCMSMIFLFVTFYIDKKYFLSSLFLILSLFMHKSGPFFVFIILFSLFFFHLNKKYNSKINILLIIGGFLIFFISYYLIDNFESGKRQSYIIAKDYRFQFLIIGIFLILLFHFKINLIRQNYINIFVYFFVIASIPVLLLGYNYEYERLQMVMIIPMIFSIGMIIKNQQLYFYYLLVFGFLLFMTINNNMYQSFLPFNL